MKSRHFLGGFLRVAGVLSILTAVLFLTAVPVSARGSSMGGGGMGGGGMGGSGQPYDVQFMVQMIPHHASAVEMAKLCLTKAVHSELRSFCQKIIDDQSREIGMMQSWLQQWYRINQAVTIDMMGQRMIATLKPLTGNAFDRSFLREMIHHHQMAVMMGNRCVQSATHTELRALCSNIVNTQSAEITQMQNWLCVWYNECSTSDCRMH